MTQGNVTVDGAGVASGTGAAKEVFDVLDATIDYGTLSGTKLQGARQRTADLANAISAIIPHITSNGKAVVTKTTSGIQRIPATPVNENDECKAPSDDKYLAIE